MFFFDPQVIQHIEHQVDVYIQPLVKAQQFIGTLLFAQHGKIMFRKGYGIIDDIHNVVAEPETKYQLCSLSKQFVALAILKLQKDGFIQLRNPVAQYLPKYIKNKQITIEHLLTHTSGIPNYTKFEHYKKKIMHCNHSLDELINLFKDKPLDFSPGAQFAYGNSGYVLLAALIEKVSGQTYVSYLQNNIFNPLNMKNSGCHQSSPTIKNTVSGYRFIDGKLTNAPVIDMSTVAGAADIHATVDDLYQWDRAAFSNKTFESSLIAQMITPHVNATNFFDNPMYGYGLFVASILGYQCFGHFGRVSGFHTLFLHFIKEDACLIMLSNFEHSPLEEMAIKLIPLFMASL